jgi:uncharacterized cupredoxin-like copper-binding protein
MNRIALGDITVSRAQVAVLYLFVSLAAVACASSGSSPSFAPSAAASTPSQAIVAPTASPIASTATASASPAGAPTISLYEWKVVVASTLKSGTSTFTISNFGAAPHELLVFKSDRAPSAYPTDAAGDIKEEGAGVSLVSDGDNIAPGGSQVRIIDLKPGKYLFVCNIAGHFKQGMFVAVTVAP